MPDTPTVTDPTDKEPLSEALASTYNTTADATPWALCQQYQAFLDYTAEHPNAGRVRVANNMLNDGQVPPSRIRVWLDDGMPDAMRGVQTAEGHGWLDLDWDGDTLHNLALAVTWVLSGGSIAEQTMAPYFAADPETEDLAHDLLQALDLRLETVRDDADGRATEVRATENSPVFGRLLSVLGAPVGGKSPDADVTLPAWFGELLDETRRDIARLYILNRGTDRTDRPDTPLGLREERSQAYLDELRDFFEDVTGHRPRGQAESLAFTPAATMQLNRPPEIR